MQGNMTTSLRCEMLQKVKFKSLYWLREFGIENFKHHFTIKSYLCKNSGKFHTGKFSVIARQLNCLV